jgi:hypothetical protein
MKIASIAALLAALTVPVAVSAQETQAPAQAQAQGQRQTNQAAHEYHRWTKRLAGINLSAQQQQQVQHFLDQFAAAHPAGSPRDPAGSKALHEQIFGVLTPAQQSQFQQQMQALKAQHAQRGAPGEQQPAQPPPPSTR